MTGLLNWPKGELAASMSKIAGNFLRRGWLAAVVLAGSPICRGVLADTAATQPAPLNEQMRLWIKQLGGDDSRVRQSALMQLMGLRREDLPALREAALAQEPLLPGQVAAIHDAVTQIYLAADATAENIQPTRGFLGLLWNPVDTIRSEGVIVSQRIPGFGAYRMLQSGDIIVKLLDQPNVELSNYQQFIAAVQPMEAGQVLRMQVMRYGRLTDISILLEPFPTDLNGETSIDAWMQARDDKAQAYWDADFSALDHPTSSASTEP